MLYNHSNHSIIALTAEYADVAAELGFDEESIRDIVCPRIQPVPSSQIASVEILAEVCTALIDYILPSDAAATVDVSGRRGGLRIAPLLRTVYAGGDPLEAFSKAAEQADMALDFVRAVIVIAEARGIPCKVV